MYHDEISSRIDVPYAIVTIDMYNHCIGFESLSAQECIRHAADLFGDRLVMTTSFGIQSAVLLHLATEHSPGVPVIWIDTGYSPPETYHYAKTLIERLSLDVHVFQSEMSPARMEALYGKMWESDDPAMMERYNTIRKVEPMKRALRTLGAAAWMSGLRSNQTDLRKGLSRTSIQWGVTKLYPILSWSDDDISRYRDEHHLPRHPLEQAGYVTVGDWHSSRPLQEGDKDSRATRFRGLKQECGLHVESTAPTQHIDRFNPLAV